jgi:hypothetical protein
MADLRDLTLEQVAGCFDAALRRYGVAPAAQEAYFELLRRYRALLAEVEGDNGLRASKEAGWAIARGRAEDLEKLHEKCRALEAERDEAILVVQTYRDERPRTSGKGEISEAEASLCSDVLTALRAPLKETP